MVDPNRPQETSRPSGNIDPLTGLLTQAAFHVAVEHAVSEREQGDPYEPLSLLYADVNNVKPVNTRYLQVGGDWLIGETARIVKSHARTNPQEHAPDRRNVTAPDIVARGRAETDYYLEQGGTVAVHRLGGDEIGIVAQTDSTGVQIMATRIRQAYEEFVANPDVYASTPPPTPMDLKSLHVGISIGTATYEPGMSARRLKETADINMHADKLKQTARTIEQLSPEDQAAARLAIESLRNMGLSRGAVDLLYEYLEKP